MRRGLGVHNQRGIGLVQAIVTAAIVSIGAFVFLDVFEITTKMKRTLDQSSNFEQNFAELRQILLDEESCSNSMKDAIKDVCPAPCDPFNATYSLAHIMRVDPDILTDGDSTNDYIIETGQPLVGHQVQSITLDMVARYSFDDPAFPATTPQNFLSHVRVTTNYVGTAGTEVIGESQKDRSFYITLKYNPVTREIDRCYGGVAQITLCEDLKGTDLLSYFKCLFQENIAVTDDITDYSAADSRLAANGAFIRDTLRASGETKVMADTGGMVLDADPDNADANRYVCKDGDACSGTWSMPVVGCTWESGAAPILTNPAGAPPSAYECPEGKTRMGSYLHWQRFDTFDELATRIGGTTTPVNAELDLYCCDTNYWNDGDTTMEF